MIKNILKITLTTILLCLGQMLCAFDGPKPITTYSDQAKMAAIPELSDSEFSDYTLEIQQIDALNKICQDHTLSEKERSLLMSPIIKELRLCGKSAFVLACEWGSKDLMNFLFEKKYMTDPEAQSALIILAKKGRADTMQNILLQWGKRLHWAREECIAIALKNNDSWVLTTIISCTPEDNSIQFQILEPEINDAYHDRKGRELAALLLHNCTPEQRLKIIFAAGINGHEDLLRYLCKNYYIADKAAVSAKTTDTNAVAYQENTLILHRTQTPDAQLSAQPPLRIRRKKSPLSIDPASAIAIDSASTQETLHTKKTPSSGSLEGIRFSPTAQSFPNHSASSPKL